MYLHLHFFALNLSKMNLFSMNSYLNILSLQELNEKRAEICGGVGRSGQPQAHILFGIGAMSFDVFSEEGVGHRPRR